MVKLASFNSDSRLAVTASLNEIMVWDVLSVTVLKEIICQFDKKFVRFIPDDRRIFSSDGKSLFVWGFPSLQELIDETRKRFENRELTSEESMQYYLE